MKKIFILFAIYFSTTSVAYASGGAIPAVLGMLMLFAIIFICKVLMSTAKRVKKGANKVRQMADNYKADLEKIELLVQYVSVEIVPSYGKVENINFHLRKNQEYFFYNIPSNYLNTLKRKLENDIKARVNDNSASYGFDYALRNFYIGDQIIFSWVKEY